MCRSVASVDLRVDGLRVAMHAVLIEAFGQVPRVVDVPDPARRCTGSSSPWRRPGCAAATGTPGRATIPTSALPHVPGHELAGTVVAVGADVRGGGSATGSPHRSSPPAAPAPSAPPATSRCAARRPSPASPGGARSPSSWPSITPTSTSSGSAEQLGHDRRRVGLPRRDGVPGRHRRRRGPGRGVGRRARLRRSGALGDRCGRRRRGPGGRHRPVARRPGAGPRFGAEVVLDPGRVDPVPAIAERTAGGAHASFDAVGQAATCEASIRCLRRRGRHVQIGLLPPPRPAPPCRWTS